MSAKIIAICNQKGGTGKTTTAVNLGTALAAAGKRVLLIDLDPQGNSTSGMGLDKAKEARSIYNVIIEEIPIRQAIKPYPEVQPTKDSEEKTAREMSNLENVMSNLETGEKLMSNQKTAEKLTSSLDIDLASEMSNLPKNSKKKDAEKLMSNLKSEMSNLETGEKLMSNLENVMSKQKSEMSNLIGKMSILPSNVDLTGAEIELVAVMGREYRLKKALEPIKDEYDFIIMDSPPSLGLLTINSLTAATSILIPVQCEYYALEGLTQLMNTIALVRDNLNPALEIEGVLLTMADYRTRLTQEVIAEVRQHFKDKVYRTVIPRNIRLTEAPSYGKPILFYDKDSIGARKYNELAEEIIGVEPAEPSFANRIKTQGTKKIAQAVEENTIVISEKIPVENQQEK